MRVSPTTDGGVIDDCPIDLLDEIIREIPTSTKRKGSRIHFAPNRAALDFLVSRKAEFDPTARMVWAHFYVARQKRERVPYVPHTEPLPHQAEWLPRIVARKFFSIEWEPGLGKTKTALDVCCEKFVNDEIDAVFVVTLPNVHVNWVVNEIPRHVGLPHVAAAWNPGRVEGGMRTLSQKSADQGKLLLIATMNFEAVRAKRGYEWAKGFLSKHRCAMIIDESHEIGNISAKQNKDCRRLGKKAVFRLIMSGTPDLGKPENSFGQFSFLNRDVLGESFEGFKTRYTIRQAVPGITREVWIKDPYTGRSTKVEKPVEETIGYQRLDELRQKLDAHRSRLLKADVADLPPKLYELRSFLMTDEMREAYVSLCERFKAEIDARPITTRSALEKVLRLQQLVCGFLVPDDVVDVEPCERGVPFKKNPRLDMLRNDVGQAPGKRLVWASFVYAQHMIDRAMREDYGDDAVITFFAGAKQHDNIAKMKRFEEDDKIRVAVASQRVAGTGVTLLEARQMFFYNNPPVLKLRLQSEDRAHRIGQDAPVTYTDYEALGTVDRKILETFKQRVDISSAISGDILRRWLSASV